MKKPVKRFFAAVMLVALALLAALPAPARAQGLANGTPDIGPGQRGGEGKSGLWESYNNNMPAVTDVLTHEGTGKAVEEIGKSCNENQQVLDSLAAKVQQAANKPGQSAAVRTKGLDLAKEANKTSGAYGTVSRWTDKAVTVLKVIDFVSTTAKAAGHLAEGDRIGAVGVVVDDVAKKGAAALGAFGLSWIPGVGPVVGSAAGEELHKKYLAPVIADRVDKVRVAEAKEKMLGPNIPGEKVMDSQGNVRTLPPDMFVNRETGNIERRTPEQQQAYEKKYRDDLKEAANSNHPLAQAARDLQDGKITDKEFDRIVDQYNNPDKNKDNESKKNKRPKGPTIPSRDGDEEADKEKDGQDQQETKQNDGEDEEGPAEEEGEEEEGEEEAPKGNAAILEKVTPIKVTASASFDGDYSAGGFKNIVTTTITVSFWNVGSLAPGYGEASMTTTNKSSMGPEDKSACGGSFSGGPNGSFHFSCEGESRTLKLSNGTSIRLGEVTLTVKNPQAFADWPD